MTSITKEEDYELNAYQSRLSLIKKADFFKHRIYENLMLEIEDEAFLKLHLGKYKNQFLRDIKEHLPYFEEIVKKELEENNYPISKQDAILKEKTEFENLVLSLTKDIDKGNCVKNKTVKKEPRGRKGEEAKELDHYLIKDWNEQGKKFFVSEIKTNFKDYGEAFENGHKQNLNLLALALADLGIIKTHKKRVLFETVLKAVLGKERKASKSDESNFNALRKNGYESKTEYINLKKGLNTLVESLIPYKN